MADFARPSPESVELLGVEANRIICLVDGELAALDTATGAEVWRLRIPQSKTAAAKRVEHYTARRDAGGKLRLFRSSTSLAEIAVADGVITPLAPTPATAFDVGTNNDIALVQVGKLALVNRGKEVWATSELEAIVAGPRFEADRILIGTGRGELVAFARADHRELWRVPLGKQLWGPIATAGTLRLVFSTEDETLFAVDPKDGAVKWRFATGDTLVQSPFEYDGSLIVVTKQNRIVRLNPETGVVAAEVQWPTWLVTVEPLTVGGRTRLAVGDVAGRLTLLGPDLKKTWESSLTTRVTGRPVVAVTPPIWKTKSKPVKGGPDDLLDTIASDAAGTKPFMLTTDGAGFLYKLSTEGIK
ncbi:MAG: PQQ-binding-like beta-propeller repeat protein [Planctomycetes bacterium]|nr:PQQ-binding-like beta-propeller repeat protein [Planctomycetota bacterium]